VHAAAGKLKPDDFAQSTGQLYQSELHIHPGHMLDWDKPLGQHHSYVRDRLLDHGYGDTDQGKHIYTHMAGGRGGDEAAARRLLDAGIPGIRYLDAGSRASGHGSHNYVVFDPRTINIVKRNGMPAMIDAGADALRDHKKGTP
jgi:hypothetical protein